MWWKHGGYVAMRTSRHITGFHWLWSKDLKRWIHYEPIKPKQNFFSASLHKIWYKGTIRCSDIDLLDY